MSNVVTAVKPKSIREHLLAGAKVSFGTNGSENVYTIEGVRGLEISERGYIIDRDVIKYPKPSNDTVYIGRRTGWESLNIAFRTLITLLNGYIPHGGLVIEYIDKDKGWRPDNLIVVDKFSKKQSTFNMLERISEQEVKVAPTVDRDVSDDLKGADLYSQKEQVDEYVTEDFAIFPTMELAKWHQDAVYEAKNYAQIVLDHNGGYALAEKIYREKVVYNKDKPYENFRDVMDNNKGIVIRKSKELVKFKDFKIGEDPKFAYLFSGKTYAAEVAEEIVSMLTMARDVYESLHGLSMQTSS